MFKKLLSIILSAVLIMSFAGCTNNNQTTTTAAAEDLSVYSNYSNGLDENGYYVDITKKELTLPDFSTWQFTSDEVISWAVEEMGSESIQTTTDYQKEYALSFLIVMGYADKEIVEEGDSVSVDLEFTKNGNVISDLASSSSVIASTTGDEISKSCIGKSLNETYTTKYTFPSSDTTYANQVFDVKVTITSISNDDILKDEIIKEYTGEIEDAIGVKVETVDELVDAVKPFLAEYCFEDFITNKIRTCDFEVPEEFVNYELYRLKARLNQLGYTYEFYKESMKYSEEDITDYCAQAARENTIAMLVGLKENYKYTEEEVREYFGEDSIEGLIEYQGFPYLRLEMMCDNALLYIIDLSSIKEGV